MLDDLAALCGILAAFSLIVALVFTPLAYLSKKQEEQLYKNEMLQLEHERFLVNHHCNQSTFKE